MSEQTWQEGHVRADMAEASQQKLVRRVEQMEATAKVRTKICGLKRFEDITYANTLKPDYVGFVFAPGGRRTVTAEQAVAFREKLDGGIPAVGVFLNQPVEDIIAIAKQDIIQVIQLHGQETQGEIERLQQQTGLPVIKAFSVRGREDIAQAQECPADYVLLDNSNPGSGKSFDWSLLSGISRPYFLAGGLSPENVGQALEQCANTTGIWKETAQGGLYALDVSSGVEREGVKNFQRMQAFLDAVKAYNRQNGSRAIEKE